MRIIACWGVAVLLLTGFVGCTAEEGSGSARLASAAEAGAPATTISAIKSAPVSGGVRTASRTGSPGNNASSRRRAGSEITTGPQIQVLGRVTFDDGTPLLERVTSATVELWATSADGGIETDTLLGISDIDERGRYLVSGPDGENRRVEVKGVSRAIADLPPPDDRTTASRVRQLTQNFLIPTPHTISGRVLDSRDKPVASALVSLRSDDAITDGWYYGNQQTTASANGEFTINGVAAGAATIGAAAAGYGAVAQDISVPTSGPVTLRLTTGTTTLHGHVLQFPSDAPLAGAKIKLQPSGAAHTLGLAETFAAENLTGSDGSFRFTNLSAGEHRFTVISPDGNEVYAAPDADSRAAMAPRLLDGQITAATLRVFAGYTITGLVYDKDTSEPLAGATVAAYRASKNVRNATTGDDGMFRLERIGADWDAALDVALDGYVLSPEANLKFRSGRYMRTPDYPKDTDQVRADVPMVAVVSVSGRVEDKDGKPVAGADLEWNSSNHLGQYLGSTSAKSDAVGRFAMQLAPFQEGLFEVTAEGYAFKRSDGVRIASVDIDEIIIVLESGGSVEGRVVNPDGDGVAGAAIQMREGYTIGNSYRMQMRQLAKSGPDGSFRADNLSAKVTLQLEAIASGYSPGSSTVYLNSGDVLTGIEIKLAGELTIDGRVLDVDDQPVAASLSGLYFGSVLSNADGAFELTGLRPGEVQIFVHAIGTGESKSVNAKAGDKNLIIRMGEKEQVVARCTVVDSITKGIIEEFDVDNVGPIKRAGPGEFSFSIRPGTSMTPRISAKGYATKTFRIEAPKDAVSFEQTLEMGVGAGVSGRTVDADGDAVANVPVAVYELSGGYSTSGPAGNSVSGEDGRFLIAGVPAGEVRVTAMPRPPAASESTTVELTDGEVKDVGDLVIGTVGSLSGKVIRMPSGDPVSNAYVNINGMVHGEHFHKFIVTETDGLFHVEHLQPGLYGIMANNHTVQVEIKSGEEAEAIIELGSTAVNGKITRNGLPVHASISARNPQTGMTALTASSPGGSYEFTDLPPGTYEVEITPLTDPANPAAGNEGASDHRDSMTVPDEEEVQKDFVLP